MARLPIERAVLDPGFTPSLRDLPKLIELLGDDDLCRFADRSIGRLGEAAVPFLKSRFEVATPSLRARLVRTMSQFGTAEGVAAFLLSVLDDDNPKTRRNAVIALGHTLSGAVSAGSHRDAKHSAQEATRRTVEEALLTAWQREPAVPMRRSLAAAMGKVGTERSLEVLALASTSEDAELSRIAEQARLIIQRTASRGERGTIDAGRRAESALEVVALARRGLEGLLAEELAQAKGLERPRVDGPGRVRVRLGGPLGTLFCARTMLSFQFPLNEAIPCADAPSDAFVEAVAEAATGQQARRILGAFTQGPVRYRIAWTGGEHKRSVAWGIARAVERRWPDLVNDPSASLWQLVLEPAPGTVAVSLAPRALEDPRFRWRRRDVPAASHPTLAAALVRIAGVRADDVVWDPFVGSGAELVERALASPVAALIGTDTDERALAAARENLAAAGFSATLTRADALTHAPRGVTLVVTNPPMGRRASREQGLADSLDRFVAHAARVLVPGGRMAWIAPWPKRARKAGLAAGLSLDWARVVDMGGFDAEIQRWTKPER